MKVSSWTTVVFGIAICQLGGLNVIEAGFLRKKWKRIRKFPKSSGLTNNHWSNPLNYVPIPPEVVALADIASSNPYNAILSTPSSLNVPIPSALSEWAKSVTVLGAQTTAMAVANQAKALKKAILKMAGPAVAALEDAYDEMITLFSHCSGANLLTCFNPEYSELKEKWDIIDPILVPYEPVLKAFLEAERVALLGLAKEFFSMAKEVMSKSSSKNIKVNHGAFKQFLQGISELSGYNWPNIPNKIPNVQFKELDQAVFNKTLKKMYQVLHVLSPHLLSIHDEFMAEMQAQRRRLTRYSFPSDICFTLSIWGTFGPAANFWSPSLDVNYCIRPDGEFVIVVNASLGRFSTEPKKKFGVSLTLNFGIGFTDGAAHDDNFGEFFDMEGVICFSPYIAVEDGMQDGHVSIEGNVRFGSKGFRTSFVLYGGPQVVSCDTTSCDPLDLTPGGTGVILLSYMSFGFNLNKFPDSSRRRQLELVGDDPRLAVAASETSLSISELVASAHAAPNPTKTVVLIKNRGLGDQCFGYNDATGSWASDCNGEDYQQWAFDDERLQNMVASDRCLTGWGSKDNISWRPCDTSNRQKFHFTEEGLLKNVMKNKCVDLGTMQFEECDSSVETQKFFWVTDNSLLTTVGPDGLSYCLTKDDALIEWRYKPFLSLCNGRAGQQFSIDSSSRFTEAWGKEILTRNMGGNYLYFAPGYASNDNQFMMFTEDGKIQLDNGECISRSAGSNAGSAEALVPGKCETYDRTQLVNSEFKKIVNGNRGNDLCMGLDSSGFVAVLGCTNSDMPSWKLEGGSLVNSDGNCMVPSANEEDNLMRVDSCDSDAAGSVVWEYDPDAFWLSFATIGDESPLCLATHKTASKSTVHGVNCWTGTTDRFQWGEQNVFMDPATREQFYFSGIPFKIHVMSETSNKCLQKHSDTQAGFGTCGGGENEDWVYNKKYRQLAIGGRCLVVNESPHLSDCAESATSSQEWGYDKSTRQVFAIMNDETQCLLWQSGSLALSPCDALIGRPDNSVFGPSTLPIEFTLESAPGPIQLSKEGEPTRCGTTAMNTPDGGNDHVLHFSSCDPNTNPEIRDFYLPSDGRLRHAVMTAGEERVLLALEPGDYAFFVPETEVMKFEAGQSVDPAVVGPNSLYLWEYDPVLLVLRSTQNPDYCVTAGDFFLSRTVLCDTLVQSGWNFAM